MRIIQLGKEPDAYSCNSYLILGDWNRLEDVNTLIDPGRNAFVVDEIEQLSTGFGKVPVEQILLTHNHSDHAAGVLAIKQKYGAKVLAFADMKGVDGRLKNGQVLKVGDGYVDVIHTPGHSSDSVCFYYAAGKVLFSGDTQLRIRIAGQGYAAEYIETLRELAKKDIRIIYSGHDAPLTAGVSKMLQETLRNIDN